MSSFEPITFRVVGVPQTQGSKSAYVIGNTRRANVVDANWKKLKPWRKKVREAAEKAYQGPVLLGPMRLDVVFVFRWLEKHKRTGKYAGQIKENAPLWKDTQPDLSKLVRAIEDSLTGVIWKDDSQVCAPKPYKVFGHKDLAGVYIRVRRPTELDAAHALGWMAGLWECKVEGCDD